MSDASSLKVYTKQYIYSQERTATGPYLLFPEKTRSGIGEGYSKTL